MNGVCPDDTQIALRTQGLLAASATEAFDAHVDACPRCYAVVRELGSLASVERSSSDDGELDRDIADPVPEGREFRLGRYVMRRPLGAGGMGIVHVAYDPELDRDVAIKLVRIRQGAGTDEQRQGLLREAKALARLRHPNVVNVHDVGLQASGVYLVMELVDGETLTAWRRTSRTVSEILAVFTQIGQAVATAHQHGLVHRDIKPDNILVGVHGRAQLADFGLARAFTNQTLANSESVDGEADLGHTQPGTLVGSPRYTAPEVFAGARADALSDQFSFCVALYETLYGEAPFPGDSLAELSRHVRAGNLRSPPLRLRVPARVRAALRRGLATAPHRRFANMTALVRALRPRRWGAVALAAIAGAGATAVAVSALQPSPCPIETAQAEFSDVWTPERSAAAKDALMRAAPTYAAGVWQNIGPELEDYAARWVTAHHEACEATHELNVQSSELLDRRFACLRYAREDLRVAMDLLAAADESVAEHAHLLVDRLPDIGRCADLVALQSEGAPADAASSERIASIRGSLAEIRGLVSVGRHTDALDRITPLASTADALHDLPLRSEVHLMLARARTDLGDHMGAEAAAKVAFDASIASGHWENAAQAAIRLAYSIGQSPARSAEARVYAELAKGIAVRLGQLGLSGRVHSALGQIALAASDFPRAVEELRTATDTLESAEGPEGETVALARMELTSALVASGEFDEARREAETNHAILGARLGAEHPVVNAALVELARVNMFRGAPEVALTNLDAALASHLRRLDPGHPWEAQIRFHRGEALLEQRQLGAATGEFRAALAIYEARLGGSHPRTANARGSLALSMLELDPRLAASLGRRALADIEAALGARHMDAGQSRWNLAQILARNNEFDEAVALYRLTLDTFEPTLPPNHPMLIQIRADLGSALVETGQPDEARVMLESTCDRIVVPSPPSARPACQFALARALWSTKPDRARARAMAQVAQSEYQRLNPRAAKELVAVEDWLATHAL